MVSVGATGQLGGEWSVQKSRQDLLSKIYGQEVTYAETIGAQGIKFDDELDRIGVELQVSTQEDFDFSLDLLNDKESVWNNNNRNEGLFQSNHGNLYTQLDFMTGTYTVMSEKQLASSMGIEYENEDSKPFDYIKLDHNGLKFTDLVFAGAGDGQNDRLSFDLSQLKGVKWGNASFNIEDIDGTNVQIIKDTIPQYMLEEIESALSGYVKGSQEYNTKFLELAVELMDQEGYTKGQEIASPANTTVDNSSKAFNVVRDASGRVRIMINSNDGFEVKGAGVVKGSGMISLGATTDGTNESVVQIGNSNKDASMNIDINNKARNIDAYGENVNANFNADLSNTFNVNWGASNGSINASDSPATMFLNGGGANNTFNLSGKTYVIDENKANNTYNWKGNTIKNN